MNITVPCKGESIHCAVIMFYFMALLVKINWEGRPIHYFFCGWVGVSKYYLGGMECEFFDFFSVGGIFEISESPDSNPRFYDLMLAAVITRLWCT